MRDITKIYKLLNEGKHFCINPWVHLHVTGLGMMAPCSHLSEGPNAKAYGNLNESTFHDLWQGEGIREIRLKMLRDEELPGCSTCYAREKEGYRTSRLKTNALFRKYIDWVVNTDERGFAPDATPVSWDIRFSNLCNLKCRSCCYSSSSSWQEDEIALGLLNPEESQKKIQGVDRSEELLNELDIYFPKLEHVYFAGGEPILMKENYYILNKLIELKKFDIDLLYSTNFTMLDTFGTDMTVLWKRFKNITVSMSLDAAGQRGEYMRKGLNWKDILINRERVKKDCPNVNLVMNTTASVFNILHLPDFQRELIESGFITPDKMRINILYGPSYYSIRILPEILKEQAEKKIEEHIAWLKRRLPNEDDFAACQKNIKRWMICIEHMKSRDNSHLLTEFKERTAKLDAIRGEDIRKVFPELLPIFESL